MTDPTPPTDTDSVLQSVKKVLNIPSEYTAFDLDVTLFINTVLGTLFQLGVGTTDSQYEIMDGNDTWSDIVTNQKNLAMIRGYIFLRVRNMFDPPTNSATIQSYDNQIKELEWRINVAASSTSQPASNGPAAGFPTIWDLTGLTDFPASAPTDAVGIDLLTGIIWRNS